MLACVYEALHDNSGIQELSQKLDPQNTHYQWLQYLLYGGHE